MKNFHKKLNRCIVLALAGLYSVVSISSLSATFSGTARAATLDSITIEGEICTLKLVQIPTAVVAAAQGEFSNVPSVNTTGNYGSNGDNVFGGYSQTNIALPMRWYAGPLQSTLNGIKDGSYTAALKSDMSDILGLADPNFNFVNRPNVNVKDVAANNVMAIIFNAKVAGNGDPQKTCRHTPNILFSRPSKPSEFFGTYKGNGTLLTATLDATTKTISFGNTAAGADTFAVAGDAALFSNPLFGSSGNSVGFCSGAGAAGVQAYTACMQANVRDFNTIMYRGEKYVLDSWQGNQSIRMEYILDVASSPYNTRKAGLGSCATKPKFRIDGDNAGKINELTTDGDNGISGFFGQLTSLATVTGSQTIQYVDVDLQCNVAKEANIELFSLKNFLNIAQYFAKDNAVIIIPRNPGDGEKPLSQTYTKSTTDPTLFVPGAGAKAGSCDLNADNTSIKFTSDPSSTKGDGTYIGAYWTFPNPSASCSAIGANINVKFTAVDSAETLAGAVASIGNTASSDKATPKTCSSEGGVLGWIICPVLLVLDESTQWLESQIRNFLFVEPGQFDRGPGERGEALYKSWSTFRGLATVIIVIIALIMIFSQAMGDGIFDNYSVKKLLPRLVIAGISIQLSWFMLTELVNVFNIIGNGVGGLLMSPFNIATDTNLRDILPNSTGAGQGLMAGIVIAGSIALVGAALALAIGAAAAVFIGFITLLVRNMIILVGIVLAPIALAMSVLPGTQKTSKWWWESLEKALLMYPIVIVLLASGKILSKILISSGDPNASLDAVTTIAAIAAWYAPFFFLPKALQAGGQALGKITGFAGDKSKGMFDRAKGWNGRRQKVRQSLKAERNARLAGQGGLKGMYGKVSVRNQAGVPLTGGIRGRTIPGTDIRFLGKGNINRYNSVVAGAADKANAQAIAEEKALLQADKTGIYSNPTLLLKQVQTGTPAQSRAAADRLVEMGADKEIRMMRDGHSYDATGNLDTSATTIARNQESRERFTAMQASGATFALKDKAPDVAMAKPAFDKVPIANKMHDWSADTLKLALEHEDSVKGLAKYHNLQEIIDYAESDPDFAATLDADKTKAINEAIYAMSGGTGAMPPGTMLFTPAKKSKL